LPVGGKAALYEAVSDASALQNGIDEAATRNQVDAYALALYRAEQLGRYGLRTESERELDDEAGETLASMLDALDLTGKGLAPHAGRTDTFEAAYISDPAVPVSCSRFGVQHMLEQGSPVVYTEYPGVGHDVNGVVGLEGYMTRLSRHRRAIAPARIRVEADHPRYAEMYWGRIDKWIDPHAGAMLDSHVLPNNTVSVSMKNVARARLEPPTALLTNDGDIHWLVAGKALSAPRSPNGVYEIGLSDGDTIVRPYADEPHSGVRLYVPGSFMELYRGEPLRIVYGTMSEDDAREEAIKEMAEVASRCLMPGSTMEFGQIPTLADTAVGDEDLERCNLFLIGGPNDNSVTADIMRRIPVRESNSNLHVFDMDPIPLDGRGYSFVHPSPQYPQRLVFVYASSSAGFYDFPASGRLLDIAPERQRIFDLAENDPSIPDVMVESVNSDAPGRVIRALRFSHGWTLPSEDGRLATRHPRSERDNREMMGEVYRRAADASYAVVTNIPDDMPCLYDPTTAEWRDIRALMGHMQLVAFEVTGVRLLTLMRPIDRQPWSFYPRPDSSDIDRDRTYRIAGALESIWYLGRTHKFLTESLRLISDEAFIESVARDVWRVRRKGR